MKKRNILLALSAALGLLAFVSCKSVSAFSAGKKLSHAEMEEMQKSLLSEENNGVENENVGTDALPDDAECYFVSGTGTVYHTDKTCTYIKDSNNVICGTLAEASAAGKTKLCAACEKENSTDEEIVPDEPTAQPIPRTCYFVAGGSVWHYDRNCTALAQSKEILSGSEKDAINAGKSHACSRCGD